MDVSHDGTRRTATCRTKAEAELKEAELRLQIMRGKATAGAASAPQRGMSLGEGFTLASAAWAGSRGERDALRCASAAVAHWGADRLLDTIRSQEIAAWAASLAATGKSNGTINRYLAALSKIFTLAQRNDGLTRPKPHIERMREPEGRLRYLSQEEERQLLDLLAAWDTGIHDVVAFLLDTGLRVSEALALQPRDFDPAAKIVTIWVSKTDTPRSVGLTRRSEEIVARLADDARKSGRAKLFKVSYGYLHRQFERAVNHLEWSGVVLHTLRHTCCTRLVQRGVNMRVVMSWMGHKAYQTTLRYAHLVPTSLAEAALRLEA